MRVFATVACVAALGLALPASADDQAAYEAEVAKVALTVSMGSNATCETHFDRVADLAAQPRFADASIELRRLVLMAAAHCVGEAGMDSALKLTVQLEPLAAGMDLELDVQGFLISDEVNRRDFAAAARRLIGLIERRPDDIATWNASFAGRIVDGLTGDAELSTRLLRAVTTLRWTGEDGLRLARNDWSRRYADRLLAAGDTAGAAAALSEVTSVDVLMGIAEDRRYEALWPSMEADGRFSWRRLLERNLKTVTERAGSDDRLGDLDLRVRLLSGLGRYDEAIRLGQAARKRMKTGEVFTDQDTRANWLLDGLAAALLEDGQAREAEAVYLEAMAAGEAAGEDLVSQRINWAGTLLLLDRPADALALIDDQPRDSASPYGLMWVDATRVCARASLGRDGAEPVLASMRARDTDNMDAMTQALICLDRQDEAAALYIRRLTDPDLRAGALADFRETRDRPPRSAWGREYSRRLKLVLARPDVRKAFDAVGRVLVLPVTSTYTGAI